jgi:hypothetical protein
MLFSTASFGKEDSHVVAGLQFVILNMLVDFYFLNTLPQQSYYLVLKYGVNYRTHKLGRKV